MSVTENLYYTKIFESTKLVNTAILIQHVIGLTGISSVLYEATDPFSLDVTPTE